MNSRKMWFCLLFSLLLLTNSGFSQIDRQYQPVIISGENASELWNTNVDNMYLMSFNATENSWNVIAFQVDEVDSSAEDEDKYFSGEPEGLAGIFDLDDELVFIAGDIGGDRADSTQWAENTDSIRYEITLVDTVDGSMGYVYVCFSELPLVIPEFQYDMAYDEATDQVSSLAYEAGFNQTGLLSDVRILPEISGNGEEIFDRVKVRLFGVLNILFPIPIPLAEDGLEADSAWAKVGPVRAIRNLKARFALRAGSLEEISDPFVQTSFFYPYSNNFSITFPIENVVDYVDILYARLSWDMNANASGMTFYSENNMQGITVDGSGDKEGISTESRAGDLEWSMVSGDPGTMVNVFYLPNLGSTQGIFYFDNTDDDTLTTGDYENSEEYTFDTGDSVAYGDNGYFVYDEDRIEVTELTLAYYNFFLPPSFTPEQASLLTEQLQQPLDYSIMQQKYTPPTSVAGAITNSPKDFKLNQNYPNPFNASTVISFNLPQTADVNLTIYDVTGRQIRELINENMGAGAQQAIWDGRNDFGDYAPSGIYVYQLKMNSLVQSKKMVFVK
ncbi:T9SS type A sorting domain-containing protein [candidate division KSB1 bacterium]|nr:T9SS type A sorting domain-containing protein [candidate division KSB1 bacterium]